MNLKGLFFFSRFVIGHSDTVLSWIKSEKDRVLWSGNSFINGLNRRSFHQHLQRKDLFAYQLLSKEESIHAYGEIIIRELGNATLCRIIVDPKMRGKGVGRHFCERLISEITKWKLIREISLNTLTSNVAALACYESLGFTKQGIRTKSRRIGNSWHDLIFMSLRLPDKSPK